ncbi:hypothetical protein NDU88_002205 [Pleurodeles waltl]|uniref:Uncharacterized protein n=1 Tax=Pleurodeles waltl TaxID=8319 RepID=A0AAV7M7H2_PLEWA|nr:hypothetical protein NDU88_002205 [Pleurodeles waltl]
MSGPSATPSRPRKEQTKSGEKGLALRARRARRGGDCVGSPTGKWRGALRSARRAPPLCREGHLASHVPLGLLCCRPEGAHSTEMLQAQQRKKKQDRRQRSGPAAPRGACVPGIAHVPRFQAARAMFPSEGNTAQEPEGQEPPPKKYIYIYIPSTFKRVKDPNKEGRRPWKDKKIK